MAIKKIKILVIDDSPLARKFLKDLLDSHPMFEVLGAAADPYLAAQIIKQVVPDVITLDLEMPKMNGLTFLKVLMSQKPIPVVIVSSLSENNKKTVLKALELGAVSVIQKPNLQAVQHKDHEYRIRLIDSIAAAAQSKLSVISKSKRQREVVKSCSKSTAKAASIPPHADGVVVIGASSGGTEAIKQILAKLDQNCPPIAIVQHMPENFTKPFADRLNEVCKIEVREAVHGEELTTGCALIAPGNRHMHLRKHNGVYVVHLTNGPLVNRHKPSVDVLFESAAQLEGNLVRAILLTGMGKDGAQGMLALRKAGAFTVAQDEASSVVFGMPKEAIEIGAASKVLPLDEIATVIN
ncbi:MAG: protein-glutamate methylesterase/protein-glutamine glutaminase [Flammeovirgaceae bacterium]